MAYNITEIHRIVRSNYMFLTIAFLIVLTVSLLPAIFLGVGLYTSDCAKEDNQCLQLFFSLLKDQEAFVQIHNHYLFPVTICLSAIIVNKKKWVAMLSLGGLSFVLYLVFWLYLTRRVGECEINLNGLDYEPMSALSFLSQQRSNLLAYSLLLLGFSLNPSSTKQAKHNEKVD